jgi:metallophosphoesterase (TIGR03767 family)
MGISRRDILVAAGAGVVAAAIDVGGLRSPASAASRLTAGGVPEAAPASAPVLTTLDLTVVPGPANAQGYRGLINASGEPYVVRTDLTTIFSTALVTRPLVAFAHMSDLHVIDDQSPARVEFLDQYADPGAPHHESYPTGSAYRPHEFLSTHTVDAMCRAIRNVGSGPKTNLPLAFTIVTGDAVDNAQLNETRWYLNLLDGGHSIQADSGEIGLDQSVSAGFGFVGGFTAYQSYWHPDGDQPGDRMPQFGFGPIPGLLAAARVPFTSGGLGMPWYAAYGNHDVMVQGNLPIDTDPPFSHSIKYLAVNGSKPIDSEDSLPDLYSNAGKLDYLDYLLSVVTEDTAADPTRRLLTRADFVNEHFTTTGTPVGHGFASGSDHAYYAIPSAFSDLIQYITLDTTNADGGVLGIQEAASGCIDDTQWNWLQQQLIANSSRYLSPSADLTVIT